MHLTAPSNWSRSIGTGGRDPSERVVTIAGMRSFSKLVIFDPQYRHLMDRMKFGNEGERQKGRALLPQQSNSQICQFGAEIVRVLRPGG
jgi:hypothetical protein